MYSADVTDAVLMGTIGAQSLRQDPLPPGHSIDDVNLSYDKTVHFVSLAR